MSVNSCLFDKWTQFTGETKNENTKFYICLNLKWFPSYKQIYHSRLHRRKSIFFIQTDFLFLSDQRKNREKKNVIIWLVYVFFFGSSFNFCCYFPGWWPLSMSFNKRSWFFRLLAFILNIWIHWANSLIWGMHFWQATI